jgi:hypothetical protein
MGGRKPELLRIERNSGSVGAQPGVIFRRGTPGCVLFVLTHLFANETNLPSEALLRLSYS